jgi:hypothetical protein
MRCDINHRSRRQKGRELEPRPIKFIYLDVLTIAKRFEPFASVKPTRVTVLLIGAKELMRPVTPAVDVVNKSPSWYVYPCSVILFSFSLWWLVEQFCILLRIFIYLEITGNRIVS